MSTKPLKTAIIGLGHLHPRAYMALFAACERIEVVAACDGDAALLGAFCKDYGLKGYPTVWALLDKEALDMAAIFLPHCDCEAAAVQCAEKGVHLMIEKPIAHTVKAVQHVVKSANVHRVKLTTGYCWRYHPVVAAIKEAIQNNHIGRVVSVEARLAAGRVERYINGHSGWMLEKKKSGGGPMYNLGVHWIDLLCYLLDDKVSQVCATHTKSSDTYDIEDGTAAMLQFAGGSLGTLTTSYIVPDCFPNGRDLYLGIKGTKGVLSYDPRYEGEGGSGGAAQTDILELYSDAETLAGASSRQWVFQLDKVAGYSGYMGKAYVEGFIEAIVNDRSPMITGDKALSVLKVVEAIYKSDTEKQWIKVEQ